MEAKFDASFSPKALGKSKQTPTSLQAGMEFGTSDGSHPPALRQFEIGVDRHTRLSWKDVPVCRPGNVDEAPLEQRCKEALIGTGKMVTGFQFPETTTPLESSKVGIYNAGLRNGSRVLLAVTHLVIPTPTEIVITIAVQRDKGRYGPKLAGTVPKIAGGAGYILRLGLRLHKSVFSATCADRHLDAHFVTQFADGTVLGGSVERTCTPAG